METSIGRAMEISLEYNEQKRTTPSEGRKKPIYSRWTGKRKHYVKNERKTPVAERKRKTPSEERKRKRHLYRQERKTQASYIWRSVGTTT